MYVCLYIYTNLCLMKEHCGHSKIPVLQTMGLHVLHPALPRGDTEHTVLLSAGAGLTRVCPGPHYMCRRTVE